MKDSENPVDQISKGTVELEYEELSKLFFETGKDRETSKQLRDVNQSDELGMSRLFDDVYTEKKERQSSLDVIVVEAEVHAHDDDSLGEDICSSNLVGSFEEKDEDDLLEPIDGIVYVEMKEREVLQDRDHLKRNVKVHDQLRIPIDFDEIKPYPEDSSEHGELVCQKIFKVTCDWINEHKLEGSVQSGFKKVCQELHPEWGVNCSNIDSIQQIEEEKQVEGLTKMGFRDVEEDLLLENKNLDKEEVYGSPYIVIRTDNWTGNCLVDTGSPICGISKQLRDRLSDGKNFVEFPISGVKIKLATGRNSKLINRQVLLSFEICGVKFMQGCLVIDDLNESVLLGMNWIVKANVGFKWNEMKLTFTEPTSGVCGETKMIMINSNCTSLLKGYQTKEKGFIEDEERFVEDDTKNQTYFLQVERKVAEAEGLNEAEKKELEDFLWQYFDVFDDQPGRIKGYQCKLNLRKHEPFFIKPYSIPFCKRTAVEKELQKMQEWEVIERSSSQYNNPVIPVVKRNGGIRLVLDSRHLNKYLERENDHPENIDELLNKFESAKYMSSLDLTAGFHQIELEKESRKYTAFLFNGKSFQYCVVPFGLTVSVAEFIRGLDFVLGKELLDKLVIYVDDVLVTNSTWREHLKTLKEIGNKMRKGGMTLNLEKCTFGVRQMKFLGHTITEEGILPDQEKVKAIAEFPKPKSKKELKSFFGIINFYRKHFKSQALNAVCLNNLLKKNALWEWSAECQVAFEKIKEELVNSEMLHKPDLSLPFCMLTDSSGYGLGVHLFQEKEVDGIREHLSIAFASRILQKHEKNYTITEKELLAIVWGFRKFKNYLLGRKVVVYSDHKALCYIQECKLYHDRLTRWAMFLQQFDYTVHYIKGNENLIADALSRLPVGGGDDSGGTDLEKNFRIMYMKGVKEEKDIVRICSQLRRNQNQDDNWKLVKSYLGKKGHDKVQLYYQVHNGILFYRHSPDSDVWKVCWPEQHIDTLIKHTHESFGHCGSLKCVQKIQENVYFHNISRRVRKYIATCDRCQRVKVSNKTSVGYLQCVVPEKQMDLVGIDLFGQLPRSPGGFCYLFVMVDLFSKFVKLYPLKKATSKKIITKITQDYFQNVGRPKAILSDNGSQFTSKVWKDFISECNIKHILISVYSPACNPTERYMREIGRLCRTYCNKDHTNWINYVSEFEDVLNSLQHTTTGFSPYEIMFNKKPAFLIKELVSFPLCKSISAAEREDIVRKNMEQHYGKRKLKHDNKIKPTQFKIGDYVLTKSHTKSKLINSEIKKFFDIYVGPFEISEIPHPNAYRLVYPKSGRLYGLRNVTQLKLYRQ